MDNDKNDDDSSSWDLSSFDESFSSEDEDEDSPSNRDIGDVNRIYRIGEKVYFYSDVTEIWEQATIRARRNVDSDDKEEHSDDDSDDDISNMTPQGPKGKYVYDIDLSVTNIFGDDVDDLYHYENVSAKNLFKFYPENKEVELQLAPGEWYTGIITEEHDGSYSVNKLYCEVEITDDCGGQKEFYEEQLEEENCGYFHISNIRQKKPISYFDPALCLRESEKDVETTLVLTIGSGAMVKSGHIQTG